MGFNEVGQTGLALGLGLSSPSSVFETKSKSPSAACNLHHPSKINEPSLTLTLSGSEIFDLHRPSDHNMVASSSLISNVRVKREMRSFAVDGDEDGCNGRKKLRLTKAQSALLEESFKNHSTPNPKQKQELARVLHLRPRHVEVWFQNRRARTKLKQAEIDCEFLKKCCESLTDENRRLQKELHELKLAKPVFMKLPAATLAMCPSCERLAASVPENAAKLSHFNMAQKPLFYSCFTYHPSAAC